jgi:DNA-binding transcriptional LysR family regulator
LDNHYKYFLQVAEKMNMSEVARESFISHQCVSTYIRQLEDKLCVKLFNRYPKLSLTKAGETLLEALQRIRIIEDGILAELTENSNVRGVMRIGIPSSRYNTIVPLLLPNFKNAYPDVDVEAVSDFSNILEMKAINGSLDMFIGAGQVGSESLTVVHLVHESFYFMISDALLKKFFQERYLDCLSAFQKGADLREFRHVPFILTPPPSRMRKTIDALAAKNNFELNIVFQSNNIEIFPLLCQKGLGACVTSQMFFPLICSLNSTVHSDRLHVFPLNDLLGYRSSLYLAYNKQKYTPAYQKYFIELAKDAFSVSVK